MSLKFTRHTAALLIALSGLALPAFAQDAATKPTTQPEPARTTAPSSDSPTIQLAILLDTSGSMSGLIDQAKTQLWSIVNDMTRAKMEGKRPQLKVALYEYGKSSIPASEGYLRQILPLTDDLDAVSAELFKLTTNGGEEYCGKVIKAATEGLAWTSSPRDLRIMVIAGNEPFTQGDVDYKQSVQAAVKKGLIINTIFCGNESEGINTAWKDGALLGEGTYGYIDHNAAAVYVEAPQDKELSDLSGKLNTTYLAYGRAGGALQARQREQDANAAGAGGGVAAERAASKASGFYKNDAWDLVDAVKEKKVKLEEVKDEELPEAMRGKKLEEKQQLLDTAAKERTDIQKRIGELQTQRTAYIQQELAKKGDDKTLGAALLKSLRSQAESRGYAFETK